MSGLGWAPESPVGVSRPPMEVDRRGRNGLLAITSPTATREGLPAGVGKRPGRALFKADTDCFPLSVFRVGIVSGQKTQSSGLPSHAGIKFF